MKNLTDIFNESIISNIDTSIPKTDEFFKNAEAELNEIRNMTWKDILDTGKFEGGRLEFTFKFKCPNVLNLLGVDNPDADGLIVVVEIDANYNTYAVLTIKHKKQKNYNTSMITKSWVNITNYIGPIRPKKISVAVLKIQDALHKIANIETLKTIYSEFKGK